MSSQVAELEAHGGQGPSDLLKDELSQSLEELEALLKAKDEVGTFCHWSQRWEGSSVHHGGSMFHSATQTWSVSFILFQEIHILQSKKADYHEMEHERDQAIHRLRVGH